MWFLISQHLAMDKEFFSQLLFLFVLSLMPLSQGWNHIAKGFTLRCRMGVKYQCRYEWHFPPYPNSSSWCFILSITSSALTQHSLFFQVFHYYASSLDLIQIVHLSDLPSFLMSSKHLELYPHLKCAYPCVDVCTHSERDLDQNFLFFKTKNWLKIDLKIQHWFTKSNNQLSLKFYL